MSVLKSKEMLTFNEILMLDEKEMKKLLQEFNDFKKLTSEIKQNALIILPEKPTLVLDCIHFLRVNNGIDTEGIFRVNGDRLTIKQLRKEFTSSKIRVQDILLSFQQTRKHLSNNDIASLLKSYFRILKNPVLPYKDYGVIRDAADKNTDEKEIIKVINSVLQQMKEPNKSIFAYCTMFFQDIVENAKVNKMNPYNLATCLTMSLIRFDTKDIGSLAAVFEVQLMTKIIAIMLTEIDFTNFISIEKYFELLSHTKYRNDLIPNDIDACFESDIFAKFTKKMVIKKKRRKKKRPSFVELEI